jgi:hypothetical protein
MQNIPAVVENSIFAVQKAITYGESIPQAMVDHENLNFLLAQIESVDHAEDHYQRRAIQQRREALKRELDHCW